MTKKILSLLLTFCVLISCFSVIASAGTIEFPPEVTITEPALEIAYFKFDSSIHEKALVGYDKEGNIVTFTENPFVIGGTYCIDMQYTQMSLTCVDTIPDSYFANDCTFEMPYLVFNAGFYAFYFAFDGEKIILPNVGNSYAEGEQLNFIIKRTYPTLISEGTNEYPIKCDDSIFNDGENEFQILDAYFVCDENGQPLKFEENPFEIGKYYSSPNFMTGTKFICTNEPIPEDKKPFLCGHEFEGPYLKYEYTAEDDSEVYQYCIYLGIENGYFIYPEEINNYGGAGTLTLYPLVENKLRIEKGTVIPLDHIIGPDFVETESRVFTTDDTNIAVITDENILTAVNVGKTVLRLDTVLVTGETPSAYLPIEVYASATGITANDVTVNVGENKNVNTIVTPFDSTDKLTYTCADESIATVDNEGNVTGIKLGTTTVTVTAESGVSTTVNVTVLQPATGITASDVTVNVGETKNVDAIVTPANTTDTLTYVCADESIAIVDNEGNVTGVNPGSTTVIVTAESGVSTTVNVTVLQPTTGITANDVTLNINENKNVNAIVTPSDTTDTLTYVCADESIAIVDNEGNVTGIKPGSTTVTITAESGVSTTVNVTVLQPAPTITAFSLTLNVGENKNVNATVKPDETLNKDLIYISGDESIAIVDANGNVTGISAGTTTITIKLGDIEKVVTVAVIKPTTPTCSIVFGKTDGIGWYNVSRDGGQTFEIVFGNSTLEVEQGTELIIKVGDLTGDAFTFYVNGNAVTPDENGCITLTVDGYMLIGALSVSVPDVEESISLIQKIINAIKAFFDMITNMFK